MSCCDNAHWRREPAAQPKQRNISTPSPTLVPDTVPDTAPSEAETRRLEAKLYDELQRPHRWARPDLAERALAYKRQYVGIVEEGRRRIWANLFCDDHQVDWRRQPVHVDDGGDCYLQATYDDEEDRVVRLEINGES